MSEIRGQIKSIKSLADYYKKEDVIVGYFKQRFDIPLNRVLHRNQVEFINKKIKENRISEVLEIAPGPARLTTEIKGVNKGYMLDINEGMLIHARDRLKKRGLIKKWKMIMADAFDTKLKENFVSMIYTFRFIRHFKYEDRKKLYSEIRRLLRDGGYLIFDVPNYGIEKIMRKGKTEKDYLIYDKLWKKDEFIKEMENNGFEVICMKGNLKIYFIQAAISRLDRIGLGKVAEKIIYLLDRILDKIKFEFVIDRPKEWLVLCQKK